MTLFKAILAGLLSALLPVLAAAQTITTPTATTTALPTPYLGQVATRSYVPLQNLAAGSATWESGRSAHWTRDTIVSPAFVYAMYAVSSANVETATGGTTTCKTAVELTLGTRTAQNVEGVVTSNNGYCVTSFPGLTIPANSQFWLDYLITGTNGVPFGGGSQGFALPSEGWAFGTGAPTDYTVSGTPPQSYQFSQGTWPVLILAQTRQPSLVLLSDSRMAGFGDYVTDTTGDIGHARVYGRNFAYTSLSVSGTLIANFNSASKTLRSQILNGTISGITTNVPYASHGIVGWCVNDFTSGGDSAATCAGRRSTLYATYPKLTWVGETITPLTTTTDNYITTANQTVGANGTKTGAFNTLARAGIPGEAFVSDVAAAADPYYSLKWPVDRNPASTAIASASFTGVISNNTLTASSVTGTIPAGACLFGTGVAAGTQIAQYGVNSTTGVGGAGTYYLNNMQTVASVAMTTGSLDMCDGTHENAVLNTLIRDRMAGSLSFIHR